MATLAAHAAIAAIVDAKITHDTTRAASIEDQCAAQNSGVLTLAVNFDGAVDAELR